MDTAQATFRGLVDRHGAAEVAKRTGKTTAYIYMIYTGRRSCGRKVMLVLKQAFPAEFSADLDLEAELDTDAA